MNSHPPTPLRAAASLFLAVCVAFATPAAMPVAVAAETGGPLDLPVRKPVVACAELASTNLDAIGGAGSRITASQETTSNGARVCSVQGTLPPAVTFRVDLPIATWSQRFMQIGCGGLCGRVSLKVGVADGCPTFAAGGFVLATTDMGHEGQDDSWGTDPLKRADFAYRSLHLTAQTAKALIRRFYGQAERFSYFNGCSDGGREALIEAQRFPHDFNGIIAGAEAMNFQVQNSLYHGWQARSNTDANGKAILLAARLPILHRAVLAACDGLDGQKDGLISAPALCRFDPGTIQCAAGATDTSACLTAAEVGVARKFYAGPRDPQTGERLTVGGPQYGSELGWAGVYVPEHAADPLFSTMIALQAMHHLIFETDTPANFTLADLQFTRATFDRLRARHPLFDATNPDLSAFAAGGGKLILWHGWADPQISPVNTIAYHDALRRLLGDRRAESFERLYLLPGVYHCSGGEGPSLVDLVTPIMAWVERGAAPDAIITRQATSSQGNGFGQPTSAATPVVSATITTTAVARSRPVYPYPFIAAYSGHGDVNAAESYQKGPPLAETTVPDWAGSDFYRPYAPRRD